MGSGLGGRPAQLQVIPAADAVSIEHLTDDIQAGMIFEHHRRRVDQAERDAAFCDHGGAETFRACHCESILCQEMCQAFGGIGGTRRQQGCQPARDREGGSYRFPGPKALRPDRGVGVVKGCRIDVIQRDPAAARGMAGQVQRAGPGKRAVREEQRALTVNTLRAFFMNADPHMRQRDPRKFLIGILLRQDRY